MNIYSYVVTHDTGFAPNPFHGYCTLACCKPRIRSRAAVGDWVVGLTPKELEKKLSEMFASQLVSNEVSVAVTSSTFDVFVSGSVMRPGKITTSKPITAFQAVMEAGYDPVNSNLQSVMIIREKNGKYSYLTLNLQLVLDGKETQPFYLRPSDTVKVSKKVTVF